MTSLTHAIITQPISVWLRPALCQWNEANTGIPACSHSTVAKGTTPLQPWCLLPYEIRAYICASVHPFFVTARQYKMSPLSRIQWRGRKNRFHRPLNLKARTVKKWWVGLLHKDASLLPVLNDKGTNTAPAFHFFFFHFELKAKDELGDILDSDSVYQRGWWYFSYSSDTQQNSFSHAHCKEGRTTIAHIF